MRRREKLHVRPDLHIVTDRDLGHVKRNQAPIRECSGSDVHLETVVSTERRGDDSAFADAPKKSTQDAVSLGIIIASRGIELGDRKRSAITLSR
jgi:hypothetical protein